METDVELKPRTTTLWNPMNTLRSLAHAPAAIASGAAAAGGAALRGLGRFGDWLGGEGGGGLNPGEGPMPDMPIPMLLP